MGKAPSGGGRTRRDSRSSAERPGTGKQGQGGKPAQTKPAPAKGKPQPQRRPQRETPEALAERLIRTFPPKASEIPEYLKSCRAIQTSLDSKTILHPTPGELFYLIASCVETLAEDRVDHLFDSGYRQRMNELRTAAGLEENEFFKPGDPRMSEEYKDLLEEFRGKKREILATFFHEHGQQETASMVVEEHEEYRRRRDEGRQSFIARDPLDPFVGQVISGEINQSEEEKEEEDL